MASYEQIIQLIALNLMLTILNSNGNIMLLEKRKVFPVASLQCIGKTIAKQFKNEDLIIILTEDSSETTNEILLSLQETDIVLELITNTENMHMKANRVKFPQNILLLTNSLHQFVSVLNHFKTLNVDSKIVIVFCEETVQISDVRLILELMMKLKLINTVVSVNEHNETMLYTSYPYSPNSCEDFVQESLIGKCGDNYLYCESDLFPDKLSNIHGCPLEVGIFPQPPYTIPKFTLNEYLTVEGLEGNTVQTLAQTLNFTLVLRATNVNNETGYKHKNGTYFGVLGDVFYGKVDIGIGGITPTDESYNELQLTRSLFTEHFVWAVPKSDFESVWRNIFRIFDLDFWFSLGFTVVLLLVMFLVFNNKAVIPKRIALERISLAYILSLLFGVSVYQTPKSCSSRILFLSWVLYALVIRAVYMGTLFGFFIVPISKSDIEDTIDIVKSGLSFGGPQKFRNLFRFTNDSSSKTVYNKWVQSSNTSKLFDRTAYKKDFAFVGNELSLRYMIQKNYRSKRLIRVTKDIISTTHTVIVLPKSSIFFRRFNMLIERIFNGGLPMKWFKEIFDDFRNNQFQNISNVITFTHLTGAFGLLLSGLLGSAILFVIEYLAP